MLLSMRTIWKRVASLLATIFLLAIIGFVLTNLVLTRQPTAHPQLAYAASPPTAQVISKPFVTGVYRFGINTGPNDSMGPGDFMANMFDNPGFEPLSESHLIIIGGDATSSTFTDASDPSLGGGYAPTKYPTGFWNGGKASVRTGAAAGDQFTITSYTSNGSYTFGSCLDSTGNFIGCPTLVKGAAVAEVQTGTTLWRGIQAGGGTAGDWFTSDATCNYSTSHPYDGRGSLACSVADGEDHVVHYIWDQVSSKGGVCSNDNVTPCTVGNQTADCGEGNRCLLAPEAGPWHPVKGAFEIAFWAMGSGTSTGTPMVKVALSRSEGTDISHTFTLTNDGNWHQYVYAFTGNDVSWKGGQHQHELNFKFITTNTTGEAGASIYIDDAYLGKQAASTTGFRDEFVTTLQAINPGSIRLMGGGTMAASRVALEGLSGCKPGQGAGPDTPGTCDFQHGPANSANTFGGQWTYSSSNLYPLANQFGAAPWFSISNAFSDADLRTFIDNACTALTTNTNIPAIYIEQSNEEWNIGGPSFTIRYGSSNLGTGPLGYGGETGRNFSIMSAEVKAHCASLAGKFYYVIGNQTCNNGVVGAAIQGAANAGYPIPNTDHYGIGDAPYYGASISESGSLAAQAQAYAAYFTSQIPIILGPKGTGCMNNGGGAEWAFIGSNNFVGFYETAPNASGGPASTEQHYLSEAGYPSAAWMAYSWLLAQKGRNEPGIPFPGGRIPVQNEFTLVQTEFGGAPIWGFVHDFDADFGPAFPHLRPIGIGMQVINSAVQQGGALFGVTGGPSSVVVNPYNSNSSGTGAWSAALVNTSGSATAYSLTFLARGTVPARCEATVNVNGITDNSENSNDVAVGSCTSFSCAGQTCSVTLQPYQVVAMDPTGAATLTPRSTQPAH
jgi:hypothetical protein